MLENTYNEYSGSSLVTDCTRCPERTSTLGRSGQTSVDACFCAPLFYLAPETMDVASRDECLDRCCTCPVGSDCSGGAITLADLPILPGYFRRSFDHIDVRRCPDAAANCRGGKSTCLSTTSACQGGRSHDAICRPGLTGIFCRSCVEADSTFRLLSVA